MGGQDFFTFQGDPLEIVCKSASTSIVKLDVVTQSMGTVSNLGEW